MAAVVLQQGTADDDSVRNRYLSAFTQLTPAPQPAVPCSPERHACYPALVLIEPDPAALLTTSQNVIRHVKVGTTYTSIPLFFSHRHSYTDMGACAGWQPPTQGTTLHTHLHTR